MRNAESALRGTVPRPSFASMAREYLSTLNSYRQAKSAAIIADKKGHDTLNLAYHAAQLHVQHQEAFAALVRLAVRIHEAGPL